MNTGPREYKAEIPTIRQENEGSNLTGLRVHERRQLICNWPPLKPNGYLRTTRFNIQELYVLSTQCIYVFWVYLCI